MESMETITRWSLKDLLPYPFEKSLEVMLLSLEQEVTDLESLRISLTQQITQAQFNSIIKKLEFVNSLISKIQAFSNLWLAEDTQNKAALNLRDRLDQSLVDFENRILFFDLWFKELPEDAAQRLISWSGDLKYLLRSSRRFKPYTLKENEEKLINLKDINGIDALVGLYDMITNRFVFNLEMNGEKKQLTRDEISSYFFNPSSEIRLAAYREFYRVYIENSTILAQIYSHRVRDWHNEGVILRGYSSAISARNLGNDIPDEVVEILLAVCRSNAPLFQKYFLLKAKWLGLNKLRRSDIYAPLNTTEKRYSFAQAIKMVMDSFNEFSPQIAKLANRVIEDQHFDPHPRHGKRGGAFCSAILPGLTPWVLVNFNGRANDIPTIAHELGHAVHAMLAKDHSVMTFHASLPLAETASVFAEMNMTQEFLKNEVNPIFRRDLMMRTIDDAYITVLRQAYFTLFEKDAHQMIVDGKSFEELADYYLLNLKEQFGDAVEVSDIFKWEWITVPHIYNQPFYTYAYCFGQLLVLSLYQLYRKERSAFIPKYLKILSYGGSEAPTKILKEADIDISKTDFWQSGFDILEEMITDLTKIA